MAAHPVDLSTLADGSSCSLASLHVESILKDMPGQKLTFVHAKSTEEKDAVLILEKTPIDQTLIQAALSDRSTARVDVKNDVYHNLKLTVPAELNCLKGTLIYPATSKHIEKYSDQEVCMVNETPLDYEEVTKPYMLEQEQYLKWVYNLLDHKAEAERIVFEDPDPETGFILAPDLKWDGTTMENMYLTAIVRKKHLLSLRELTTDHLPLLKNVLDKGTVKGLVDVTKEYFENNTEVKISDLSVDVPEASAICSNVEYEKMLKALREQIKYVRSSCNAGLCDVEKSCKESELCQKYAVKDARIPTCFHIMQDGDDLRGCNMGRSDELGCHDNKDKTSFKYVCNEEDCNKENHYEKYCASGRK